MSIALVLGGGAPNLTIMSGVLAAFDERGVEFDIISTSGAGILVGLLYAAPKGCTRQQALRRTQDMSISDLIHQVMPYNYKVFQKRGPLASVYRTTTRPLLDAFRLKGDGSSFRRSACGRNSGSWQKLTADGLEFLAAALCPTNLTPWSTGLCEPAPWISDVVDFNALRTYEGQFYFSAYNIDHHRMDRFAKEEITAEHFKASLSMPWIYPPYELNGSTYIEGCVYESLDYKALYDSNGPKVTDAIVISALAEDEIIQKPRTLHEALNQMIIVPLVRLARKDTKEMKDILRRMGINYHRIEYKESINPEHWADVLHWSEDNMTRLFQVGYQAGARFYENNMMVFTAKEQGSAVPLHDPKFKLAS